MKEVLNSILCNKNPMHALKICGESSKSNKMIASFLVCLGHASFFGFIFKLTILVVSLHKGKNTGKNTFIFNTCSCLFKQIQDQGQTVKLSFKD